MVGAALGAWAPGSSSRRATAAGMPSRRCRSHRLGRCEHTPCSIGSFFPICQMGRKFNVCEVGAVIEHGKEDIRTKLFSILAHLSHSLSSAVGHHASEPSLLVSLLMGPAALVVHLYMRSLKVGFDFDVDVDDFPSVLSAEDPLWLVDERDGTECD